MKKADAINLLKEAMTERRCVELLTPLTYGDIEQSVLTYRAWCSKG